MGIENGQCFCSELFMALLTLGLCLGPEFWLIWDQSHTELERKGKRTFPLFYQLPATPADSLRTELKMSPSF